MAIVVVVGSVVATVVVVLGATAIVVVVGLVAGAIADVAAVVIGDGVVASLVVAIAAVAFLRRGAPVAIERAGWLVGLAAGALGSVAYGITCPLDTLTHVGIVHVAPVAIGAVLGRIVVPRLIRW